MKILIVSDSHRKDDNLQTVIEAEKPFDWLIHLGDAEGSEQWIPYWAGPAKVALIRGNNDFFSTLQRELELPLGNHKVFLTHGHFYSVSFNTDIIADEAKSRGCDIAMFGHTHKPYLQEIDGVTCLNPGSISYPRQEGRRPSYLIMTISDTDGSVQYEQKYL